MDVEVSDREKRAYMRLWRTLDALVKTDIIKVTPEFAEWFYCDQPPALWEPDTVCEPEGF